MSIFVAEIVRTVFKAFRRPMDVLNPVAFFVLVIMLLSLGFESSPLVARDSLAISSLWVTVLLSNMLALSHAYTSDYDNGTIELLVAYQSPLYLTALGFCLGQWFVYALPILLLVPLGAWMMGLDQSSWFVLIVSLTAGSVVFTTFGLLGHSFTLGTARGGVLMAVLILPLYLPVLLFGIGSVQQFSSGNSYEFLLLIVIALAVACLTFLPFAIAAMLKVSQEY